MMNRELHAQLIKKSNFDLLPVEMLVYILTFLDLKDFSVAARVSKRWNSAKKEAFRMSDGRLARDWVKKIQDEITSTPPDFPDNKTFQYKKFYLNAKASLPTIWAYTDTDWARTEFLKKLHIYSIANYDCVIKKLLEDNPVLTRDLYKTCAGWFFTVLAIENNFPKIFDIHLDYFEEHMGGQLKECALNKAFAFDPTPHFKKFNNPNKDTMLHFAVKSGVSVFVERLLKLGADTGAKNAKGETPLSLAWNSNEILFNLLLKHIDPKELTLDEVPFFEKYAVSLYAVFTDANDQNVSEYKF